MAVVDELQMRAWCDAFDAAGLDVVRILPDCLALPVPDAHTWQMARIDERILVRTAPGHGFACSEDLWPVLAGAFDTPDIIELHGTSSDTIQALDADDAFVPPPEIKPHSHAGVDALIGVLLDHADTHKSAINLRQGEFARHNQLESRWRPFILTGGLAAAWLVVTIAAHGIETADDVYFLLNSTELRLLAFPMDAVDPLPAAPVPISARTRRSSAEGWAKRSP